MVMSLLLRFVQKIKKAMGLHAMAFNIQRQKSHGDRLAHPWLPVTMYVGSGAWMSPAKIKEEKEITTVHYRPPAFNYYYVQGFFEKSRKNCGGSCFFTLFIPQDLACYERIPGSRLL
jgi:hypothetical protein